MRDIATHTRITPNQRVNALEQFCKRVNAEPKAKEILQNWGLTLQTRPLAVEVRQMGEEEIQFARKSFPAGENADYGKYSTNNQLLQVVHLSNWLIIHVRKDERCARAFIECMDRNCGPMGVYRLNIQLRRFSYSNTYCKSPHRYNCNQAKRYCFK